MMMQAFLALIAGLSLSTAAPAASPERVPREPTVFAVLCVDDPERAELRRSEVDAHLAYVEANIERYAAAGPLYDADGAMRRSLFLIYAEDEADAQAFMAGDPYVSSGLYASIEYRRFLPAAGRWIGGVVWAPRGADPVSASPNTDDDPSNSG